MSSFVIKGLVLAAILIVGTLVVVQQMHIDLSDPINMITFIGAVAIAVLAFGVSAKYMAQMKTDTATGELAEENWDGIGEYKNELPAGWAYSFLGTIIWAAWYWLAGYPLNAFSQIGQYNEEVKAYQAKFQEKWKNPSEETLKEMGESIFLVQCAPCHGETGDGLSGKAQDFTKLRTKEEVLEIIKNGQNALGAFPGGMPPGMAQGAAAEKAAEYVASGCKGTAPAEFGVCAGCHGASGEGIEGAGPSLQGYDVKNALAKGKVGKIGVMPSFVTRFTPVQEKALETYVKSLAQ
jgi:cytochrome c oxidase cbb3-type subunit 3